MIKNRNINKNVNKDTDNNTNNKKKKYTPQREKEKSPCGVYKKCGSCKMVYMSYEEQLKQKQKRVEEALQPYCRPEPIIGMKNPMYYRNKMQAVYGQDRQRNPITGVYEEGTRRIVVTDDCLVESSKAQKIMVSIRGLLKSFKIRPYYDDTGYGLLRHIMLRTGHVTGEIMVVLILGSPVMPSKNNFVKALLKLHPEITTIVVQVNQRGTGMALGGKEQVLYGKGYIEDVLCGKTFRIYPKTVYPVNSVQAELLYQKVLELGELKGSETVLDAYCGIGTIGLIASDKAKQVIGVERNEYTVREAVNHAKNNKIENIHFYKNDADKLINDMAVQQKKVDVLFMDLDRKGCEEAFLNSIIKMCPKKIVYLSSNPEALAKDLQFLTKNRYLVKNCVILDCQPHTGMVQCVVQVFLK